MRRIALGLILGALAGGPAMADPFPVGRWLTADHEGVIEITPCGRDFCGRVVGMTDGRRPDGSPLLDFAGHPRCGLTILRETAQIESNLWRAQITNPDDGKIWRCEIWVDGDVLHLRGYVLLPLFGRTTDWTHFRGQIGPDCAVG